MDQVDLRAASLIATLTLTLLLISCMRNGGSDPTPTIERLPTPPVVSTTSASLPTPGVEGEYLYTNLTFEEAQQLVPFELVAPRKPPPGYELEGVFIKEQSGELPDLDQDPAAIFTFDSGTSQKGPFILQEVSYSLRIDERDGDVSRFTISGVEVTRQERDIGRATPIVSHLWTVDGVTFLLTTSDSGIAQESLEEMIGAMISA